VQIPRLGDVGSPAGGHRLDGVDLLRGAAIFFVLMNHVNMRLVIADIPYGQSLPHQLLASLVWSGQYGVQIFFAVSGYLITSTSLRRWRNPSGIRPREFYGLRLARIAPLLALLLAILTALHYTHSPWFYVSDKVGGLARALAAALMFRINVIEAQWGYLPGNWDVLWSLSVEEVFYLAFPLACLWLGRGHGLIVLLIGLVGVGPFARTIWVHGNEVWQEYSYLGGMDAIALGCLTALVIPGLRLTNLGRTVIALVGLSLLFVIVGASLAMERWGLARLGIDMTLVAMGTCLVIASNAPPKSSAAAVMRPLIWLGRRSYEIYLTHMFAVVGLFVLFTRLGKPQSGVPWLFGVTVVVAGLVGELVARLFSEPMNDYLRRRFGLRSVSAVAG
jgi:peptidoglycan/LPS O-acetylase OafA/YrhL